MPNLTDLAIKNATPPAHGSYTLWDDTLKGFGCRLSPGGAKSFVVLVASGRRKSIGRYGPMTLAKARDTARKLLAEKTLGMVHPERMPWQDAVDDYLAHCERHNRPRTVRDYRRHLALHYRFGRRSVGDITPREVLRNLAKLNDRPGEKEHAFRVGRTFFRWCVRQHIIDRSPMENLLPPPKGTPRERALSPDELKALLTVIKDPGTTFKRIVLLMLLTGQRRGEITGLQWDWIGYTERTITFPSETTKNKRTHTIPLGDWTEAVLYRIPHIDHSPYVFPAARDRVHGTPATVFNGFSKAKKDLDAELANIAPWTLHDLRRTVSSSLAPLGVDQIVVEKLLNHVSGGTQSPIAAIYNRYSYLPEMTEAIERWEHHLAELAKR